MPTMTLLQILTGALRDNNIIPVNAVLDNTQSQDAKTAFNMLLGYLSADGLTINALTIEGFPLVVGQVSYTIGSAGNFNTSRPEKIIRAYIRDSGGNDYPVDVLMGEKAYSEELDKDASGRPDGLWFNPTYPLGTIYLNMAPNANETLYLTSEKPLSEINTLTTNIVLPNEYLLMLQTNLAVIMCPRFERQPNPALLMMAEKTKKTVMRKNLASQMNPLTVEDFPTSRRSSGSILSF